MSDFKEFPVISVSIPYLYHTTLVRSEHNEKQFSQYKKKIPNYKIPEIDHFSTDIDNPKYFTISKDLNYCSKERQEVFLRYDISQENKMILVDARERKYYRYIRDDLIKYIEKNGYDGYLAYDNYIDLCLINPKKFIREDGFIELPTTYCNEENNKIIDNINKKSLEMLIISNCKMDTDIEKYDENYWRKYIFDIKDIDISLFSIVGHRFNYNNIDILYIKSPPVIRYLSNDHIKFTTDEIKLHTQLNTVFGFTKESMYMLTENADIYYKNKSGDEIHANDDDNFDLSKIYKIQRKKYNSLMECIFEIQLHNNDRIVFDCVEIRFIKDETHKPQHKNDWQNYIIDINDLDISLINDPIEDENKVLTYNNDSLYIRSPPVKRNIEDCWIERTKDEQQLKEQLSEKFDLRQNKGVWTSIRTASVCYRNKSNTKWIKVEDDDMADLCSKYSLIECIFEISVEFNELVFYCVEIRFVVDETYKTPKSKDDKIKELEQQIKELELDSNSQQKRKIPKKMSD